MDSGKENKGYPFLLELGRISVGKMYSSRKDRYLTLPIPERLFLLLEGVVPVILLVAIKLPIYLCGETMVCQLSPEAEEVYGFKMGVLLQKPILSLQLLVLFFDFVHSLQKRY